MAVYTVYYDASGDEESTKRIVVTGLVATERKWGRFEDRWNQVLSRFNVHHFHMQEFAHSKGEFAGWKGDDNRRAEFLRALVAETKQGVNKVFNVVVENKLYVAMNRRYCLQEWCGNAFGWCAAACTVKTNDWIMKRSPQTSPIHVFERGDVGAGVLVSFAKHNNFNISSMGKKDEITGRWYPWFQAADFLSWEVRRGFDDRLDKNFVGEKLRASFREIIKQLPLDVSQFDEECFVQECERNPNELPRRKVPVPPKRPGRT